VKASSPRHAPPFQLPPSGADNCVDLHG
jgi:hypothetical protein